MKFKSNLSGITTNKHHPSTIKELSRAIISQTIKDIASGNGPNYDQAAIYIDSDLFECHKKCAKYPDELLEVLKAIMVASRAERIVLAKETRTLLDEHWNT